MTTSLYRTVAEIAARSRWCLTGTPIQNRLEDIGSLFAFLRISPFHSLAVFRKHVVLPFEEGGSRRRLAVEHFTRLLDSLCLRQTKDLLQLPEQRNRTRIIEFSQPERTQYEHTQNTMFRAISNQNGMFDAKSTLGMFQVRLQLRIMCNHGTWQQPFSWSRRKLHMIDEREALEGALGQEGEITCSACRQTMPLLSVGSMFRRYTEHCRHVLCLECLGYSMLEDQEKFPTACPLCAPLWGSSAHAFRSQEEPQEDLYFRGEGHSSKMEALVTDVLEDITTSKRWLTKGTTGAYQRLTTSASSSRVGHEHLTYSAPISDVLLSGYRTSNVLMAIVARPNARRSCMNLRPILNYEYSS